MCDYCCTASIFAIAEPFLVAPTARPPGRRYDTRALMGVVGSFLADAATVGVQQAKSSDQIKVCVAPAPPSCLPHRTGLQVAMDKQGVASPEFLSPAVNSEYQTSGSGLSHYGDAALNLLQVRALLCPFCRSLTCGARPPASSWWATPSSSRGRTPSSSLK